MTEDPAPSGREASMTFLLPLCAMTVGVLVAGTIELAVGTWNWPDAIGPAFLGVVWTWYFLTRRSTAASTTGDRNG